MCVVANSLWQSDSLLCLNPLVAFIGFYYRYALSYRYFASFQMSKTIDA
jgi:hypothetical protein